MRIPKLSLVATRPVIGDTEAVSGTVAILARRYHEELLRILRARLKSEEDAADLAQEAYVRLLRYEGQCSAEELRSVLFRIAGNLMTDHWRWRRLRGVDTHLPIHDLTVESNEPSHDHQLAAQQQLARLEQVVLGMPEKRRTIFVLSRIHGLSNSDIARQCGISVKTVEKHLALALAECRAEVGDHAF